MDRVECSRAEAAAIAIRAQGLDRRRLRTLPKVLAHLGAVQLDTIAVLARSHELVAYARLGAVPRERVEATYWGHGRTFEYWSHAACILPADLYPLFAFRRRAFLTKRERWGVSDRAIAEVRARIADGGPQTATDLGGARREAGWWRWSEAKDAVEWLLAIGEVAVTDRRAWRRVYDLAERTFPLEAQADWVDDGGVTGPSDAACVRALLGHSVRVLGIGTLDDVQDVHRIGAKGPSWQHAPSYRVRDEMRALVDAGTVREVMVEGQTWYADPAALRGAAPLDRSVTTLLSPFDTLVWHRPRLERLFGLRLRIEAYTPKHRRTYGYFAMPVLHEGRIIGLVDPAREGDALVARRVTLFHKDEAGVAQALADAARWVGRTTVRVEQAASAAQARRLTAAANAHLNAAAAPDTP